MLGPQGRGGESLVVDNHPADRRPSMTPRGCLRLAEMRYLTKKGEKIQTHGFQMKMIGVNQFYLHLRWVGRRTNLLQKKNGKKNTDILEWTNMFFSLYSYLRIMKTPVYPKV